MFSFCLLFQGTSLSRHQKENYFSSPTLPFWGRHREANRSLRKCLQQLRVCPSALRRESTPWACFCEPQGGSRATARRDGSALGGTVFM